MKDQSKPALPVDALYNIAEELPREVPLAQSIEKPERAMRNLADDPAHARDLARLQEALGEISRKLPHSFGEFTDR